MKLIKKVFAIAGLLIQCTISMRAQNNAEAAIEKIAAAYKADKPIILRGNMRMYVKDNPGKIIEQMKSSYLLKGANFTYQLGTIEMLLNDKYYVSVDKSIKLIAIGYRKDLSGTENIPVLQTGQIMQWINKKTIKTSVSVFGNTGILQFKDAREVTGYRQYTIQYDTTAGYMKKVLLETADDNDVVHRTMVIEIDYTAPTTTVNNKDAFSEKRFFSIINHKIRVADNYKQYQLINQL